MFEPVRTPLLTKRQFRLRVARQVGWTTGILIAALGIGVIGYHVLGRLGWIDALLNASMILGGMGPIDPLPTDAAKVFASFYALFSGLVFIAVAGLLVAPFAHRLLHKFHWEDTGDDRPDG